MNDPIKLTGDILSGSVVVATLFEWAPLLLALPSAVYASLRVWEWLQTRKRK